jgi:hypothetical protein
MYGTMPANSSRPSGLIVHFGAVATAVSGMFAPLFSGYLALNYPWNMVE